MLKNLLRSGMRSQQMASRYYIYGQSGRAYMGNPEPVQLPKHIFQYQYAFDSYPDQFNGFLYLHHDDYALYQVFSFENFAFKYSGEQWHMGSVTLHWLCLLFPLICYAIRVNENDTAKARRGTRSVHYNTQGGFLDDALERYDETRF